jgi:hypothetical protein
MSQLYAYKALVLMFLDAIVSMEGWCCHCGDLLLHANLEVQILYDSVSVSMYMACCTSPKFQKMNEMDTLLARTLLHTELVLLP